MNKPLRILLVDDHAVVREGLRALLDPQQDMVVVGEAGDSDAAVAAVADLLPDVVLMDIRMPGTPAVEAIDTVRRRSPDTHVLVFTGHLEADQLRNALDAGASGYLLKDAMGDDLVRAVRAVAAGQAWLHPAAQAVMLELLRRPPSPIEQLTARERSVLELLAEGLSNKMIARKLGLSTGTVKGYVSQIFAKLDVADRTQAALLAHHEGINASRPRVN